MKRAAACAPHHPPDEEFFDAVDTSASTTLARALSPPTLTIATDEPGSSSAAKGSGAGLNVPEPSSSSPAPSPSEAIAAIVTEIAATAAASGTDMVSREGAGAVASFKSTIVRRTKLPSDKR